MPVPEVESSYSVITEALVTLLRQRSALADVNVLDHIPTNKDDIRTPTGAYEVIAMAEAEGPIENVVFCDGGMRFDETLDITVVVEVHGTDSADTQGVVRRRVNQLLYQLYAEIAGQKAWDRVALGLDVFEFFWIVPAAQSWRPGRLQQTGVFALSHETVFEARSGRFFV